MRDWQNQAHVKHYYKYHLVFVSKYRKGNVRNIKKRQKKNT